MTLACSTYLDRKVFLCHKLGHWNSRIRLILENLIKDPFVSTSSIELNSQNKNVLANKTYMQADIFIGDNRVVFPSLFL